MHRIDVEGKVYFYQVTTELKEKTYQWCFDLTLMDKCYSSWILDEHGLVKGFKNYIQVSPDNIKEKLKTILTFL